MDKKHIELNSWGTMTMLCIGLKQLSSIIQALNLECPGGKDDDFSMTAIYCGIKQTSMYATASILEDKRTLNSSLQRLEHTV